MRWTSVDRIKADSTKFYNFYTDRKEMIESIIEMRARFGERCGSAEFLGVELWHATHDPTSPLGLLDFPA